MGNDSNYTSYDNISDMIGKNYSPKNKIPPEIGMKIMDDLKIIEETDCVINGSFGEWSQFVVFVIDKYLENNDENSDESEIDLRQLKTSENNQRGYVSEFLDSIVNGLPNDDEHPKLVNLKGELPHFDRFYEVIKEYEKNKLKNKEKEIGDEDYFYSV